MDDDEAGGMMLALVAYRFLGPQVRQAWREKLRQKMNPRGKASPAFWVALSSLKSSVFGFSAGVVDDPKNFIWHPWSLSPDEFQKAWVALAMSKRPPDMDKNEIGAKASLAIVSGTLATAAYWSAPELPAFAAVVGALSALVAAVGTTAGVIEPAAKAVREAVFTRTDLPKLRELFEKDGVRREIPMA